jgi:5'-nucleotidase
MLADAFRNAAGAQIGFVNNGGIRVAELPAGPVTWGQLYTLTPFENRVLRIQMSGSDVRSVLEYALRTGTPDLHVSGLTVVFNPSAPVGHRVERVSLADGSTLNDAATYSVAIPDFLAAGTGDGYAGFAHAKQRADTGLTDLESVIKYLQGLPQPVRIDAAERRFLLTPTH